MKIKLSRGLIALVDKEDLERLSNYKWCANILNGIPYALTNIKGKTVLMHRFILDAEKGDLVDHKNRNSLDNRKRNLRICDHSKNGANSKPRINTTSKYKGVHFDTRRQIWVARIRYKNILMFIGEFKNEISAAKAYNECAKKYFKEFSNLNRISHAQK